MGHMYVGKVISALTGLAELHNLITVAGENREKGRGQEARDGRHEDEWEVFFKCQSVCVCVCVCVCVVQRHCKGSVYPIHIEP